MQLGAALRTRHPTAQLRLEAKEVTRSSDSGSIWRVPCSVFLTATDRGTHGTSQTAFGTRRALAD